MRFPLYFMVFILFYSVKSFSSSYVYGSDNREKMMPAMEKKFSIRDKNYDNESDFLGAGSINLIDKFPDVKKVDSFKKNEEPLSGKKTNNLIYLSDKNHKNKSVKVKKRIKKSVSVLDKKDQADQEKLARERISSALTDVDGAINKINDADKIAEKIINNANAEASIILREASNRKGDVRAAEKKEAVKNIAFDDVMNEKISVEISAGTVDLIAKNILPRNWRVVINVKSREVKNKRYFFVSSKSRGEALNDLSSTLGLKFYYFYELKNSSKDSAPLLIVSDL